MNDSCDTRPPKPLQSHVLLSAGGTSLLLDIQGADQPIPVYWGAQLVGCDQETVNGALTANRAQRVSGGPDFAAPLTLLPQQSSAWVDGLGLAGHRLGTGFATKLKTVRVDATDTSAQIELRDEQQGLGLLIELAVEPSGLLRQRLTLMNEGLTDYTLEHLRMVFPLPSNNQRLPPGWIRTLPRPEE